MTRSLITLTPELARASGLDAANRNMRKHGRVRWSNEDWNIAAERTARLMVVGGFWPVALYEAHIGRPFVQEAA